MRALVIGGTGFVGTAACRELMRRGFETVAASRREHPYGTFTSHVAFDRRDRAALKRVLDDVAPDVVLDLACYQPAEVADVIEVFQGRRYVFVSTGVYPHAWTGQPAREEEFVPETGEPPSGELEYFTGKRWCETLLQRSGDFNWVVIRPPAVLGPGDPTLRIAAYIQRVEDGGPLLVPAETYERRAGLAWVKDIGFACALASDVRRDIDRNAYNAAFDDVSLARLIAGLAAAMGRKPEMVPIPYAELPPSASPYGPDPARCAGYFIDKARRELQFEPSQLEDALAETLAWYQVARPSHPGYANRAIELELAAADR